MGLQRQFKIAYNNANAKCDVKLTLIAMLTIHQLYKYIQINMHVYLFKKKKKLLMVAKLASLTNVCGFTLQKSKILNINFT